MSDAALIKVDGISKAFGGIMALSNVSFDVKEGEILGIIGPNGSSKTTIVNCITGFVKITAGRIFFRGKKISGKPPHKIAQVGVLRTFQIMRPYYSLPACESCSGWPIGSWCSISEKS
ncbi:putative branched-chain amino acid ABC transport system, ATP-binding protein [Desulfosarcina variabilis str. Montpellier]|uniref:ATP-binding cassette domain-containing protein n=1 Tax=Desulfosarcina variabilis TaxID=2300 RepID=UPI003AFA3929